MVDNGDGVPARVHIREVRPEVRVRVVTEDNGVYWVSVRRSGTRPRAALFVAARGAAVAVAAVAIVVALALMLVDKPRAPFDEQVTAGSCPGVGIETIELHAHLALAPYRWFECWLLKGEQLSACQLRQLDQDWRGGDRCALK